MLRQGILAVPEVCVSNEDMRHCIVSVCTSWLDYDCIIIIILYITLDRLFPLTELYRIYYINQYLLKTGPSKNIAVYKVLPPARKVLPGWGREDLTTWGPCVFGPYLAARTGMHGGDTDGRRRGPWRR